MHCLDSKQVEMESLSGFHKALVGFGTEYPSKLQFYLKGLDEEFYRRWCIARGYNPKDEVVLKAVEWFIHWQAHNEWHGICYVDESYQQSRHMEAYDPACFPFFMKVYSPSIRLIIKVIRDYPECDMSLSGVWVFPEGLKLIEGELDTETELLFKYFSKIYFNTKTKRMDVDVDRDSIKMQIASLSCDEPERIYGSVLGDYCEYPNVSFDDVEAWEAWSNESHI
jgi:hypothetical protein